MNTYLVWCLAIAGSTISAFPTAQTPGLAPGVAPASENGKAIVVNLCSFPVYYKSVINDDPFPSAIDAGSSYSEVYRLNPDGGGVSIKLSSNQTIGTASDMMVAFDESTITQFEYTYNPDQAPGLWYDMSNVNGYYPSVSAGGPWPFEEYGLTLEGSSSDCPAVTCYAGVHICTAAYTLPNDNWATHGCMNDNTLVLTLCSTTGASGYFKRSSVYVSSAPLTEPELP